MSTFYFVCFFFYFVDNTQLRGDHLQASTPVMPFASGDLTHGSYIQHVATGKEVYINATETGRTYTQKTKRTWPRTAHACTRGKKKEGIPFCSMERETYRASSPERCPSLPAPYFRRSDVYTKKSETHKSSRKQAFTPGGPHTTLQR